MPRCETCEYFRTENDCDGPSIEWCALERVEEGYNVGSYPACRAYVKRDDDEYDWDE